MANKVSTTERMIARSMASDTIHVERLGSLAITKAIAKSKTQFKRALRNGQPSLGLMSDILLNQVDELADAVMVSYLMGLKRTLGNIQLSLSATSPQVRFLADLFNLSDDELAYHRDKFKSSLSDVLHAAGEQADDKVRKAMIESLTLGEHVKPAVSRLNAAFKASGVDPDNAYQLENIFRTRCQIAYSGAKWQGNSSGLVAELLWGYKYVTVGDDRVRPTHEALDGTTLPKDDPRWDRIFAPNGWGCRCQCIEIFEKEEIQEPPETTKNEAGETIAVQPDPGFDFNPGKVISQIKKKSEQKDYIYQIVNETQFKAIAEKGLKSTKRNPITMMPSISIGKGKISLRANTGNIIVKDSIDELKKLIKDIPAEHLEIFINEKWTPLTEYLATIV